MRMLGVDVGDRRVGVAICDPEGRLAVPLTMIDQRERDGVAGVATLAAREEAERIVVGLPLSLDGTAGAQADSARAFAERLRGATAIEVVLFDERLSTVQAERQLAAAGRRTRDTKGQRDALAASIILQAYLDSLRFPPLPPIE